MSSFSSFFESKLNPILIENGVADFVVKKYFYSSSLYSIIKRLKIEDVFIEKISNVVISSYLMGGCFRLKDTSFFTTILYSERHVIDFMDKDYSEIDQLVASTFRRSITGMQCGKGMPNKEDMENLMEWCTIDGELNLKIFRSFTGMQKGKGILKKKDVECLIGWCTIHEKLDFSLLRSITGMQGGKGMPKKQDVESLIRWCEIGGELDLGLLSSITGMQKGKGMPKKQDVESLIRLCTIDKEIDLKLLGVIASMQNGKGIPKTCDIVNLTEWCTDVNGQLYLSLLSYIIQQRRGEGIPSKETFNDLRELFHSCQSGDTFMDEPEGEEQLEDIELVTVTEAAEPFDKLPALPFSSDDEFVFESESILDRIFSAADNNQSEGRKRKRQQQINDNSSEKRERLISHMNDAEDEFLFGNDNEMYFSSGLASFV